MADFRQDKAAAFTQVLRAFVLPGKAWGLCGLELVALDGSTFPAVQHRRRPCTDTNLQKRREEMDPNIDSDRRALDQTDAEEASVPPLTAAARREKMRPRRARKT